MAEGVWVFHSSSLQPLNEGRTCYQPEVVLISLPLRQPVCAYACWACSSLWGFSQTCLCRRGTLAQRAFRTASSLLQTRRRYVGNQCRIRQKGGIVSWRYFTLTVRLSGAVKENLLKYPHLAYLNVEIRWQ